MEKGPGDEDRAEDDEVKKTIDKSEKLHQTMNMSAMQQEQKSDGSNRDGNDLENLINFQVNGLRRLEEAHTEAHAMNERGEDGNEYYLRLMTS